MTGAPPKTLAPSARSSRTVASGVVWLTVGTVFSQGSTLVSNLLIANLTGPSRFGQFAIVLMTVQATTGLASLGLGVTATRYLAEWRHSDLRRAGRLLGLLARISWGAAAVGAALLALSASVLATDLFHAPELRPALVTAGATTFFSVNSLFLTGALSGLEAFDRLGITGVIAGTAYLVATALGAWVGGVSGGAFGLLIAAVLQWRLLTVALQRERHALGIPIATTAPRDERRILVQFALPGALSGLTAVPALWLVQALLARSPAGFGDVAVYTASLNLLTAALFIPNITNRVTMPWINRRKALQGESGYRQALRANLILTTAVLSAALAAVGIFGPWLLDLYGAGFRGGYDVLLLLLLAGVPEALTIALHQGIQVRERMWGALTMINLPRDLVIVAVAVVLVPSLGAQGAGAAYLAGRIVAAMASAALIRHDLIRPPAV